MIKIKKGSSSIVVHICPVCDDTIDIGQEHVMISFLDAHYRHFCIACGEKTIEEMKSTINNYHTSEYVKNHNSKTRYELIQ